MIGVEFVIVVNDVVMGFWSHEYVMPHVIAYATAEMSQEMSRTGVICATGEAAIERAIDADVFSANSCH